MTFLGGATEGSAVDAWAAAAAANDAGRRYYRRWAALLDLEQATAPVEGAAAVVSKTGAEREAAGDACLAGLELAEAVDGADGVALESARRGGDQTRVSRFLRDPFRARRGDGFPR